MKKLYTIAAALGLFTQTFAGGPSCTIDSTNTRFFSPGPDSIPCIERGVSYNQVIQMHVPTQFDIGPFVGLQFPINLDVDSMQIDSITGFPAGLQYYLNPADGYFKGGDNGCALAYGTTTDDTGNYPLTVHGTISVSGIPQGFGFPSDTSFQLAQAQSMSNLFRLAVDVIEQGAPCRPVQSGINDFSSELNALLQVYPNPNNGVFQVRVDAGRRLNGELVVVDVTGRKVFIQAMDAVGMFNATVNLQQFGKGIYTLQLRTADGFASKNISIE